MTDEKNLSLLSLCAKARKVSSGEFQTEASIHKGTARLVIIAADASDNTKRKFENACAYYEVPCCTLSDKDTLGSLIGKGARTTLAIEDEGFAKAFAKKNQIPYGRGNG